LPSNTWIPPRAALAMLGMRKLMQLTNEAGQQELIGVGDNFNKVFVTPFVFGSDLKVYSNGTIVGGYTLAIDYSNQEKVTVTFTTAPATGVQIEASSIDSVNTANLESAVLRAQGLVRGSLDAQLYIAPLDNASTVPGILSGWTAAIAWYLLASDPRRPRLLEAYPELEKRYIDVYGGVDSDLKRVAKGNFSLRGVLNVLDSSTPGIVTTGFQSNAVVYTVDRYRGVM
jgi:hypothetical protein